MLRRRRDASWLPEQLAHGGTEEMASTPKNKTKQGCRTELLREGPGSGIYFDGLHHRLQSERRVFYRSPATTAFTIAPPLLARLLATAPMMMLVLLAKRPKNLASGAWVAGEVSDAVVKAAVNETEIYLGAEGELV